MKICALQYDRKHNKETFVPVCQGKTPPPPPHSNLSVWFVVLGHLVGGSLPTYPGSKKKKNQFVSCLLSFPSHGKSADLCSWAWLRPWLSTAGSVSTWSAAVSTGPVSLTALSLPSTPFWRSTTWKEGRCVDPALGFSPEQGKDYSCLSLGGFGSRADFVHGKMDGMHAWSTAWPARFSASPCPSVIFHLTSFRLVRPYCFFFVFFFIFVFSLCLLCLPRNAFTLVLYFLGIFVKRININQSVSKRRNESPFSLPSERLAHLNTQQVLTFLKVLTRYRLAKWMEQKPEK